MAKLSLQQVRTSLHREKRSFEIISELYEIKRIYENIDNPKLLEFIPIKIVSCFEAFFRCIYKDLMDNPQNRKRFKDIKSLKNLNFDFDVLGAFQDNEISLGDYLSYLIPCSKLEDINETISTLLNVDFIEEIKKNDSSSNLLKSINEIFELRHALCHEIPLMDKLDVNKMNQYINDACKFLESSDNIVMEVENPNSPITTLEMIRDSEEKFKIIEKELDDLIHQIRTFDIEGYFTSNDLDFVDKWKEYRELRAKSEAKKCEGGSIYPVVYLGSLKSTTSAFIKELKNDYKYFLRREKL